LSPGLLDITKVDSKDSFLPGDKGKPGGAGESREITLVGRPGNQYNIQFPKPAAKFFQAGSHL
jgi:hypothetical protein